MRAIEFPQHTDVLAKDQPEYQPLPVHIGPSPNYEMTACFELTPDEIAEIVYSGRIFITQITFGGKLQPIRQSTMSPFTDPVLFKKYKHQDGSIVEAVQLDVCPADGHVDQWEARNRKIAAWCGGTNAMKYEGCFKFNNPDGQPSITVPATYWLTKDGGTIHFWRNDIFESEHKILQR